MATAASGSVTRWRHAAGLVAGPAASAVVLVLPLSALSPEAHRLAAVVVLMVLWWLTEAIPLPATAVLGAALFIALGIAPAGTVLGAFIDPIVFLFVGSFMLARALETHRLDRRLASALLAHPWVGASAGRTLWAFGLAAWLLAMWIGITACAALLFPVALSVARAGRDAPRGEMAPQAAGLLLFLVYAASAGAMATPIGTPPNLIGLALIQQGLGRRIGFVEWMSFALPLAAGLLAVRFLLVTFLYPPAPRTGPVEPARAPAAPPGPWTAGQRRVAVAFGAAVAGWLVPGLLGAILGPAHPFAAFLADRCPPGAVAMLAAGALVLIPVERRIGRPALPWRDALQIDWGTVLIFGGGIALGRAMVDTGLSSQLGEALLSAAGAGSRAALLGMTIAVTIGISNLASNTAAASMVIPVVVSLAGRDPALGVPLAVTATLAASQGFLLPVSTPANAMVYGSRLVRLGEMVRAGVLVDVISGVLLWAAGLWLIPLALR